MHSIVMLLAITPVFFTALFLMCFYRDRLRHHPMIHHLFIGVCAVFFYCWNYAAYELRWLEEGFMTLQNISPFICTVILVAPFMHKRIRDFAYCAIAFLGFGMFLAMYISPCAEYFSSLRQNTPFVYICEAACHLLMALYGFYLILVERVELSLRSFWRAVLFLYCAVGFGVFLNWCFHLSNFGMDMYGNYSIYFLDIFGSFTATFIAYLAGIFATVILGYLVGMFLSWISTPTPRASSASEPVISPSEASMARVAARMGDTGEDPETLRP